MVTIWYRSKEVLLRRKYTEKLDVWSAGCVMYEMMKGEVLFEGSTEIEMLGMIEDMSTALKTCAHSELIHAFLEPEDLRPTAAQALELVESHFAC